MRGSIAGITLIPYEELTYRGKAARLRPLAEAILAQYDLRVDRLRLVGLFTNSLFRVFTSGGPSYLLRICAPGWRTDVDLLSEAAWLQALSTDIEIGAPVPLPARSGAFLVEASARGITKPCRGMLMSWIPGVSLEKRLTEENLFKMGALFARLHESATHFSPPPGFTRLQLDSIFARGEPDVLFSETGQDAFTPASREIFERIRIQVADAYTRLYADPADLRVIHHDLHHGNIKVYRGRLHPLDFEDTAWGYPVQDIAMALQDLWLEVGTARYEPLLAAFRRGYENLSPWPEQHPGQIDTFRAGRMLWVANYVARFERSYLAGFIERVAQRFEQFLNSGRLP